MRARHGGLLPAILFALLIPAAPGYADEVLDWNQIACRAVTTAPATSPPLAARVLAMVHAAVFDAHNGIERRFEAVHVDDAVPRPGASKRAAIVQAAYAVLVAEYPAQAAALDADRAASLQAIAGGGVDESQSIARGVAWGQYVAERIRAWRAADGVFPIVADPGGVVADLGGSGMGGQFSSGHRLQVEKLSRGPSYADPPSSGGSSPCSEGKTGSNDGV